MKTGLLIQDHDPRHTLEELVARAVAIYRRKYGTLPDTCAVNTHAQGDVTQVGPVRVVRMKNVLHGHFWVGMEKKENEHKKSTR